jgi:hypothetical protein
LADYPVSFLTTWVGGGRSFKNEGSDKMNESTIERDEQVFSDELPDVALEVAAGRYGKPLYDCILHGIGHLPRMKILRCIGRPRIFTTAHDCRALPQGSAYKK